MNDVQALRLQQALPVRIDSQSVGPQPGASHGRATVTEAKARVRAAQCRKPRRGGPAKRAGPSAAILMRPLLPF